MDKCFQERFFGYPLTNLLTKHHSWPQLHLNGSRPDPNWIYKLPPTDPGRTNSNRKAVYYQMSPYVVTIPSLPQILKDPLTPQLSQKLKAVPQSHRQNPGAWYSLLYVKSFSDWTSWLLFFIVIGWSSKQSSCNWPLTLRSQGVGADPNLCWSPGSTF